jgi:hypothetical protein
VAGAAEPSIHGVIVDHEFEIEADGIRVAEVAPGRTTLSSRPSWSASTSWRTVSRSAATLRCAYGSASTTSSTITTTTPPER